MSIAYQPATTADPFPARPRPARSPHELVLVEDAPRAVTMAKVAGLLAVTAFGAAIVTAIVAGIALFALVNIG